MTIKTKLIISAALYAMLLAPASARIEGNEGGLSAYPVHNSERPQVTHSNRGWPHHYVNRPGHRR